MKAVIFPYGPTEPILGFIQDFPQIDWAVVGSPDEVAREIGAAELLIISNRQCSPACGAALRAAARSLRWIHFCSAGIDGGLAMGIPEGVAVTNSTGVKAGMVSEHALALLLALVRQVPLMQSNQRGHRWRHDDTIARLRTLEEATVCVIGQGAIGRALARKLAAIDARVIAVSRAGSADGPVSAVYPRERINEALARSDAVVICTSADAGNHHMISAAQFAAMKPTSFLVNVARGSIVDEPALVLALQTGRIAGAALDVVETEPLPAASPLWDLPSVLISPHIGGGGSTGYPQQKALFAENLARFQAGQGLRNLCKIPAKP
jgi:phosphoglycerate dehydrogenase-like enzyme